MAAVAACVLRSRGAPLSLDAGTAAAAHGTSPLLRLTLRSSAARNAKERFAACCSCCRTNISSSSSSMNSSSDSHSNTTSGSSSSRISCGSSLSSALLRPHILCVERYRRPHVSVAPLGPPVLSVRLLQNCAVDVPWVSDGGGPAPRGPPTVHAAVPTVELCYRLCDEGKVGELAANILSRILDSLRGPKGPIWPQKKTNGNLGDHEDPFQPTRWGTLKAELHAALQLLFNGDRSLPKALAEMRIDLPGAPLGAPFVDPHGPPESGLAFHGGPRHLAGGPLEEGRDGGPVRVCRYPELIFGVCNPSWTPSASTRNRAVAIKAFLSVVEEHFALMPRSSAAVNLNVLLEVVGSTCFLELLPLLLPTKQQEQEQQQQQQKEEEEEGPDGRQRFLLLQQLSYRLSPSSLEALLRCLLETQGSPLFDAPRIFGACWAAENKHLGELEGLADAIEAINTPLRGTSVSWRFLLEVAQQRQSESFLIHIFRCIGSCCCLLQQAAAEVLCEKDPLTGLPRDSWSFLMSRQGLLVPKEGAPSGGPVALYPQLSIQENTEDLTDSSSTETVTSSGSSRTGSSSNICSSSSSSSTGSSSTDINNSSSSSCSRSWLRAPSLHFIGTAKEVGEVFEVLRRQQQQQSRLLQTQQDMQSIYAINNQLKEEDTPGAPPISYFLARHRRLTLRGQEQQTHPPQGEAPEGAPASPREGQQSEGPPHWETPKGHSARPPEGPPDGSQQDCYEETVSSSSLSPNEFSFPLEIGEEGAAGLLPFAVGLRVVGPPGSRASLLCLSWGEETVIIDLLQRQEVYAAAVELLLQWLLPNPLVLKVLFDARETIEKIAVGPLPLKEPLKPLVHCIDLRQPRVYRHMEALPPLPEAVQREALLTDALTFGSERLFRGILMQQQQQQQQQQQHGQQAEDEREMQTQLLSIGTRRTLNELRRAVLGWGPPGAPQDRRSSRRFNRRPLDPEVLQEVADEGFSLLLIERRLRQHQLLPKSILGGSGVHALLFDERAPHNVWRVDREKSAAQLRKNLETVFNS